MTAIVHPLPLRHGAAMLGADGGGDPRLRLLTAGARVWQHARDRGRPVQPVIARLLGARALPTRGLAILAPVIDALCSSFTHALQRSIRVGTGPRLTPDEALLARLLTGARCRDCIACSDASATMLDCALCSARIMFDLAAPGRGVRAGG